MPEAGLGDLALYENILRFGLTKIATKPEVFPCAEVIGWILPKIETVGMIINDEEGKPVASFALALISKAYSLPEVEISVTTDWVKSTKFDYTTTVKGMMTEGKTFRHKQLGEYEKTNLQTPFRLIALMLSRLYGRCDGKTYIFGWTPLMYYVAMEGTVFNWVDISTKNLSKGIKAAQEGLKQSKLEFFMSSFLIDCILYKHRFEKLDCIWIEGKAPIYIAY